MALMLDMSDYDLTDRYIDERSSVASSINGRHPRGDSPEPYRDTDGSTTDESSRAESVGSLSGVPSSEMPSLDRLLAFLDDEVEGEQHMEQAVLTPTDGGARMEYTSTDHHMVQSALHARPSSRHEAPTPSLNRDAFTHTSATLSPAPQPPISSPTLSSYSARSPTRRASPQPEHDMAQGTSPSLRQGTIEMSRVASPRREHSTQHTLDSARHSFVDATGQSRNAFYPENSEAAAAAAAPCDAPSKQATQDKGTPPRCTDAHLSRGGDGDDVDSVVRLAEEVMIEFESVAARNKAPLPMPSPPPAPQTTAPNRSHTQATQASPLIGEEDLLDELSMARAHISHLQDELRAVSSAVVTLRAQESEHASRSSRKRDNAPGHVSPGNIPQAHRHTDATPRARQTQLSREDRATLKIAQHLLAVHSLSPNAKQPPSNTIDRALSFVRRIDSLVNRRSESTSGQERSFDWHREEAVFAQSNLDSMLRTVEEWQRTAGA